MRKSSSGSPGGLAPPCRLTVGAGQPKAQRNTLKKVNTNSSNTQPKIYSHTLFSDPRLSPAPSLERQAEQADYAKKRARKRSPAVDESLGMKDEGLSVYHKQHVKHGHLDFCRCRGRHGAKRRFAPKARPERPRASLTRRTIAWLPERERSGGTPRARLIGHLGPRLRAPAISFGLAAAHPSASDARF